MLERGIAWLEGYQAEQVQLLKNAPAKMKPYKEHADNLDALVYMVAGRRRRRATTTCATSSTATAPSSRSTPRPCSAWPCTSSSRADKLAMILQNIEQFVVQDDENQTAYLKLPGEQLLVVLVRQRDRGQRLLPEAAGPDRPQGREGRRGW